MVVGGGQMHFFSDHERARVKAKALRGIIFRVPIFEDFRPRDGAAAPLPGWADADPWSDTELADPPAPTADAAELYEIESILTDAGVTSPGTHGVSELVGERDGYRDRAAELEATLTEVGPMLDNMRAVTEELARRATAAELERDEALTHLRQATQPSGFARRLPDQVGETFGRFYAGLPPIGAAAALALSGPESLGIEPVVSEEAPPGFDSSGFVGQPWCPPLPARPELYDVGPVGGYAVGRGLAVPEAPEEERSGGLAFHR